jgi:isoleucyl-tRNA synthetase
VNPWEAVEKFGADTLRLWMYGINQPGDAKNFDEKTVDEMKKKVVGLLDNIVRFYELYASDNESTTSDNLKPTHVLDQWILARLKQLITGMTANLEAFDLLGPVRAIRDFIADFSQWYIRRSRDRFKAVDSDDAHAALKTIHYVLSQLAKVMAPFTPFMAEEVYQKVRTLGEPESVHLALWPELEAQTTEDEQILLVMDEVRRVVSLALEARAKAGVKVRQPLQALKLKTANYELTTDLLQLIKNEVNVKEVVFDETVGESVELDTTITPALKEEGWVRELVRNLQDIRKAHGLIPQDSIEWQFATDPESQVKIERAQERILADTRAANLDFVNFSDAMNQMTVEGNRVFVRLTPL